MVPPQYFAQLSNRNTKYLMLAGRRSRKGPRSAVSRQKKLLRKSFRLRISSTGKVFLKADG